jgi:hypothetical protein
MSNEVGEKTCGFREILGGLGWDDEREPKLVLVLDRLYENSTLAVPYSIRGLKF